MAVDPKGKDSESDPAPKEKEAEKAHVPASQSNLEGGTTTTIAPEQLVEQMKQEAGHIPGGNEAMVTLAAQVPTADSEIMPQDLTDLPGKAKEITDQHEANLKGLADQAGKDIKSQEDLKREAARKDQEQGKKEIEERDKLSAEADKRAEAAAKKAEEEPNK